MDDKTFLETFGISRADAIASNGELSHAGVKGMKWGVRKAEARAAKDKEIKAARNRLDRGVGDSNLARTGAALKKTNANLVNVEKKARADRKSGAITKDQYKQTLKASKERRQKQANNYSEAFNKKYADIKTAESTLNGSKYPPGKTLMADLIRDLEITTGIREE